jgi:hypothetical protein
MFSSVAFLILRSAKALTAVPGSSVYVMLLACAVEVLTDVSKAAQRFVGPTSIQYVGEDTTVGSLPTLPDSSDS